MLFLLLPLLAFAAWDKIDPRDYPLAPPPAEGSAAYRVDFEKLHAYERSRTEEQCRLARFQRYPNYDLLFGKDFTLLTPEEKEKVKPLALKMMRLAEKAAVFYKNEYARPRPYDVDPTLQPCGWKPGGATSYPSSHAADAVAGACVLALYYPDRAEAILAYGDYLGELRVIAGVHHPSDVEAGRDLGKEVCARAREQPDFPLRKK